LEALGLLQRQGKFVKEYGALTDSVPRPLLPGFPPGPAAGPAAALPLAIESGFRPYGPGRRSVRPVVPQDGSPKRRLGVTLDQGGPYKTEILERQDAGGALYFRVQIRRGFRHQIRCHLSWLGHPVLGDGLYGQPGGEGEQALMLQAQGLSFPDPYTGETRRYRLPSIAEEGF
jgi:23S rRNA pseudouridine1911/1915/1917 synthase